MPFILLQAQPPANMLFLFAAFALTWVIFFGYAFIVSRRRQDLERELAEVERSVTDGDSERGEGM